MDSSSSHPSVRLSLAMRRRCAAVPDLSPACHSSFHFDSASFLISVWSAFFVGFVLMVAGVLWPSGLGSGGFHGVISCTSWASIGDWMKMFSKLDKCTIFWFDAAASFAFAVHCLIGCLLCSDCILATADRTFVCSLNQAGCIADSSSIAAVGVVQYHPVVAFMASL